MTSADTLTDKCRKLKLHTYIIAHIPAGINVKLSCPDLTICIHVNHKSMHNYFILALKWHATASLLHAILRLVPCES